MKENAFFQLISTSSAKDALALLDPKSEAGRFALQTLDEQRIDALRRRHSISKLAKLLMRFHVCCVLGTAAVAWAALYGVESVFLIEAPPFWERIKPATGASLFGALLAVKGYLWMTRDALRLEHLLAPLANRAVVDGVWTLSGDVAACSDYLVSSPWTSRRRLVHADREAVLHLASIAGVAPTSRGAR